MDDARLAQLAPLLRADLAEGVARVHHREAASGEFADRAGREERGHRLLFGGEEHRVVGRRCAGGERVLECPLELLPVGIVEDVIDDRARPGPFDGQLSALHEHTAALPEVEPAIPELPYGRDTVEAMQAGVCRGLIGAVRALVEGYAASLNRWPQVIATGGDLKLIAPHCDFLDTLVEHLTLRGIGLAYTKHLEAAGA